MREIGYFLAKIKYKILGNRKEVIAQYFRNAGMSIGKNSNICCNIMSNEPYLISIGDNVTIAGNVCFITHDNSVAKLFGDGNDLFGKISIGDNCFIGQGTTILYGVNLPSNTIVAAGSNIVNSPKREGTIIGGNPAKVIGMLNEFKEKSIKNVICTKNLNYDERKRIVSENKNRFVKR